MSTVKENPNSFQAEEGKSTRPNDHDKLKTRMNNEIRRKKPKNVIGNKDEEAADETPFDSKSNNMHQKR